MEAKQIISQLAEERTIENILTNLGCTGPNNKDLAQDLYISLLEKDEELIQTLYEKDELKFYISRMALNNVNSKTSPYFLTYRKKKNEDNYGLIEDISHNDRYIPNLGKISTE